MLFERIVLRPNDFEISPPTKGVRENTIYAVRMQYFNDPTTDDNGAYVKSYNTKRNFTYNMTLRGKQSLQQRLFTITYTEVFIIMKGMVDSITS